MELPPISYKRFSSSKLSTLDVN